jgi:esterase/lipase superfamily enzyme
MQRLYKKWFSKCLQKDMEILVFGFAGTPVIMFPTRTAHFYDYEDWKIIASMSDKINSGQLQVFCVDSNDIESFYSKEPATDKIKKHLQYEQYILKEVLPFIRTLNKNKSVTVAGCSLGGYHAVNLAFKHPRYFSKVVGMSSRYDLTLSSSKFPDLLDGVVNEDIYFNMPSMFIPNLADKTILRLLRKLKIIFAIGKEDPFFENNVQLYYALVDKNIHPEIYIWDDEAHRPRHWRQMVKLYL